MMLAMVLRRLQDAGVLKRNDQPASPHSRQVIPLVDLVRIRADSDEQQQLPRQESRQPSPSYDDGANDEKHGGAAQPGILRERAWRPMMKHVWRGNPFAGYGPVGPSIAIFKPMQQTGAEFDRQDHEYDVQQDLHLILQLLRHQPRNDWRIPGHQLRRHGVAVTLP